ncbi:MAG: hypothetical protein WC869_00055 [Phycisphaerae bacterium]|jgi:hypothetical protein
MKKPDLAMLSHCCWDVLDIFDTSVPGLVELLEADGGADKIHGAWGDLLIRHGDDGGWCTKHAKPRSKLHNYLEKIRLAAGFPATGQVFYLLVKRS